MNSGFSYAAIQKSIINQTEPKPKPNQVNSTQAYECLIYIIPVPLPFHSRRFWNALTTYTAHSINSLAILAENKTVKPPSLSHTLFRRQIQIFVAIFLLLLISQLDFALDA